MENVTYYSTRDEAVAEIVEALGEYASEHDVEAIADRVLESGAVEHCGYVYWQGCDADTFWEIAAQHAIA